MKLSKITIVFFALIGKIFSTGIVVETSEPAESSELIVEAMVNVLTSCYGNRESAIGVYGNLPETFMEKFWSRKHIPIVLINETEVTPPRLVKPSDVFHHRKINVFLIMGNNRRQISHGLKNIIYSRWFNRRASFLVVNWTSMQKYGCHSIVSQFVTFYLNKVFNVNILCLHSTKGRMMFGYNPHTYNAPTPWNFVETRRSRGHKISIFERKYGQKGICKNLDFDKTIDLDGGPIDFMHKRSSQENLIEKQTYLHSFLHKYQLKNILDTFVRQLNGTVRNRIAKSRFDAIVGIFVTSTLDLDSGFSVYITYPCMQHDLKIMTHFEGHKSQLRKILTVVDVPSRFGTGLALLVTLIFFKCFVGQASIPASLNIVRIVCNTGFVNLPANIASRIYLTGLFLFVVTMQGIFSGNLASLLTKDEPVRHAETIGDLLDRNYTIYASKGYAHLFTDPMYKGRIALLTSHDTLCYETLLRDHSVACVDLAYRLEERAPDFNGYVSRDITFRYYWTYGTECNWVFVEKFDKMILTMTAADIVEAFEWRIIKSRINYVEPEDNDPKVMTLKDLRFTFVILGIGLACATVSFIAEISIKPIRSVIAKVRRRLYNCFR